MAGIQKSKEEQANVFKQGKQIDPRDTTAGVFFNGIPQDASAGVFEQGFSLEGIKDPAILKQKQIMAFGQIPLHESAKDFIGSGPDPRDKTAIDFLEEY